MSTKLLSKNELLEEIKKASESELSYILGRYCGPHNVLIASRRYSYDACQVITRLVNEEMFTRELENTLLGSLISDN